MFQLNEDDKRRNIMKSSGPLLIMGGPGSGKTTIALFKAKHIIERELLQPGQKVLFLSFARATISRVEEQAGNLIPDIIKMHIEINTYHGFIWNILKHHGYLLNRKPLKILPPHEAARKLASVEKEDVKAKMEALFVEEGLVHFDLFACLCARLLKGSVALRKIVSDVYPTIILDEFQDTNSDEWALIQILGENSRLIALADPDQRIYDFRGADPKRITDFIETYSPSISDFGTENNRSNGTDIVQYGNDLLAKTNCGKSYNCVSVIHFSTNVHKSLKHLHLKLKVLQAITYLSKSQIPDWSIAVLVPTNALMLEVSDFFQKEQVMTSKRLPPVQHEVAIESAGPSLAALFVATILSKGSCARCSINDLILSLIAHILGRKGSQPPSKADIATCNTLQRYLATGKITGKNKLEIVNDCNTLVALANTSIFCGNIIKDWKQVVEWLGNCSSDYLQKLAYDVQYLRLLQRGSQLLPN